MKNPNSPSSKLKKSLSTRWKAEDYPGAEPRFQIKLFFKDFAVYIILPSTTALTFKACDAVSDPKTKHNDTTSDSQQAPPQTTSQIIDFTAPRGSSQFPGIAKRSPGTLVKLRLLNVVETYSTAPVHAQILDTSLGTNLFGATVIGDASSDTNFDRINISFRLVRDPRHNAIAIPISARALSLDGTAGIEARKKEGFFARATLNSTTSLPQDSGKAEGGDLKQTLIKALTSGLLQEFGSESSVAKNRAQVLTLRPSTEFYAELTDYFPGVNK